MLIIMTEEPWTASKFADPSFVSSIATWCPTLQMLVKYQILWDMIPLLNTNILPQQKGQYFRQNTHSCSIVDCVFSICFYINTVEVLAIYQKQNKKHWTISKITLKYCEGKNVSHLSGILFFTYRLLLSEWLEKIHCN